MEIKTLEEIIEEHKDHLFRFAFFHTGSINDAQEIVQDVFVRVYKKHSVENTKAYLYKSVSNACIDLKRKKHTVIEPLDKRTEMEYSNDKTAEYELQIKEEYNRINNLLSQLPQEQADAIKMRVIDEMNFTDIAMVLSLPVTTIKSRFKYGIDKLKIILNAKTVIS